MYNVFVVDSEWSPHRCFTVFVVMICYDAQEDIIMYVSLSRESCSLYELPNSLILIFT